MKNKRLKSYVAVTHETLIFNFYHLYDFFFTHFMSQASNMLETGTQQCKINRMQYFPRSTLSLGALLLL